MNEQLNSLMILGSGITVFAVFIFGITYYNLRKNSKNTKKLSKKKKREMMEP